MIVEELADAENVFLLADEGCGNEVNLTLAAEDQVVLVLLCKGREMGLDVGEVYALVLAENLAVLNGAVNVGVGAVLDGEGNEAVIEEDGVARLEVMGQILVGYGGDGLVADDIPGGEGEVLSGLEGDILSVLHCAGSDLRSLGIKEDCAGLSGLCHKGAKSDYTSAVFLKVTMGKVKTHTVHAGCKNLGKNLFFLGLGSDGADNLCFFHKKPRL